MKLARYWKILSYSPVSNIITLCSIECNSCQMPHGSKQLLFVHYFVKPRGTSGKRKVHYQILHCLTKWRVATIYNMLCNSRMSNVHLLTKKQPLAFKQESKWNFLNKQRSLQHPLLNFFFARSLLNLVTFWLRYISPKSFYGLCILWVMMVTESNNRILH